MKKVQFSRAGKRRFNARVTTLSSLLKEDERLFLREWHKQVQGWLGEVQRRAKNWRDGSEFRNAESADGSIVEGRAHIFGVLEIANIMLKECDKKSGRDVEKLVGAETRRILTNECIKAVASVCDGRFNHMVDHRLYRRSGN